MNKIEREKLECLIASAQDLLNADATLPELKKMYFRQGCRQALVMPRVGEIIRIGFSNFMVSRAKTIMTLISLDEHKNKRTVEVAQPQFDADSRSLYDPHATGEYR